VGVTVATMNPTHLSPNFIYLVKHDFSKKTDPLSMDNLVSLSNSVIEFESQLPRILEMYYVAIVVYLESPQACLNYLRNHLQFSQTYLFIVVFHAQATEDASFRWNACSLSANMVTNNVSSLKSAISSAIYSKQGSYQCPYCEMNRFEESELREHVSLYHESYPQYLCCTCPICLRISRNFYTHIFHEHGEGTPEERTGCFSICIVQRQSDKAFLMVQERGSTGFWVPGGGLNPGETFVEGALRETLEEAGVFIDVKGIIQFENASHGKWKRVVFYAEPKDENQLPKTIPDYESNGACWVKYDQLKNIKLRSASEPIRFFKFILDGGRPGPLEVPTSENKFYNQHPPLK